VSTSLGTPLACSFRAFVGLTGVCPPTRPRRSTTVSVRHRDRGNNQMPRGSRGRQFMRRGPSRHNTHDQTWRARRATGSIRLGSPQQCRPCHHSRPQRGQAARYGPYIQAATPALSRRRSRVLGRVVRPHFRPTARPNSVQDGTRRAAPPRGRPRWPPNGHRRESPPGGFGLPPSGVRDPEVKMRGEHRAEACWPPENAGVGGGPSLS
jgi:hypothetical protein